MASPATRTRSFHTTGDTIVCSNRAGNGTSHSSSRSAYRSPTIRVPVKQMSCSTPPGERITGEA